MLRDKLLDLIYDAASDDALWPRALTGIADATGSQGAVLFGQSMRASTVYFDHNGRLSEECNAVYKERHMHNPWSLHMDTRPTGAIVTSDEVLPLAELARTAFYDEVLRPQDLAYNAMVPLARREDFHVAFNLCRSTRQGTFGADEKRDLASLVPHMQRSLLLGLRLEGYQALQRAQFDLLDRLAAGVVVLDQAGCTLFANRAARALAAQDGPLVLRSDGLGGASQPHARRLGALIRAALHGAPLAAMSLPCPADGRLVAVLVAAVRGQDIDRLAAFRLSEPAVLVFLSDPAAPLALPAQRLADAYGLTVSEARVALSLSAGGVVADAARRLGISLNTAKTHLGRVFAKTGTSRQPELARLIASLGQICAAPERQAGRDIIRRGDAPRRGDA